MWPSNVRDVNSKHKSRDHGVPHGVTHRRSEVGVYEFMTKWLETVEQRKTHIEGQCTLREVVGALDMCLGHPDATLPELHVHELERAGVGVEGGECGTAFGNLYCRPPEH
jgi:hypothetical protein